MKQLREKIKKLRRKKLTIFVGGAWKPTELDRKVSGERTDENSYMRHGFLVKGCIKESCRGICLSSNYVLESCQWHAR